MTSETSSAEQQPDHYDTFADAYARANDNGLFNRWYASVDMPPCGISARQQYG